MRSARELIARAGRPWHAIRSFTLLETLVAVGALAFVAAGIAVIFENTGKTITTGKRVSVFNAAAAAIEQRLRTDIASMTREGFLLIRNEFANPGTTNPVPLYEGDTNQRQRRTDELMFFAKGEFESARVPLFAGLTPRSDAARIYYGHGTRWKRPTLPANPNDPYLKPDLNNVNQGQLQLGYNDPNNPNRYASDWTLLRQVTLLCRPQPSDRVLPQNAPAWLTDQTIKDTSIQVALQPAASDIFRRINSGILPAGFGSEIRQTVLHPVFASGLVDVATTDLTTIRAVVTTADNGPGTANAQFYIPLQNQQADGGNAGPDGQYKQDSATNDVVDRAHSWILDALPAESHSTALSDFARVR
jgi:type II secretory pathway pseudopilin PulG